MASDKAKAYHYQVRRKQTQAPRRASADVGGAAGGRSGGGEGSGALEQGQTPIANQGMMPRASVGNAANGNIRLDSILSSRPNTNFDASAPIGGENVPYKPTTGVGGWFRRLLGDNANMQNVAAQREQGAQMREDSLRQAGMDREDAIRREGFDREDTRSEADRKFRADEAEKNRDQQYKIENERAMGEQFRSAAAEDRYRAAGDEERRHNRALEDFNQKKLDAEAAKDLLPRFTPLGGGGGMFQSGDKFSEFSPGMPGFGNIPGKPSTVRPLTPFSAPQQLPVWPGGGTGAPLPAMPAATNGVPTPQIMPRASTSGVMQAGDRLQVPLAAEEQSIDPYELSQTTPAQGVMIDPVTRRARLNRLLNPNTPAWKY